MNALMQVLNRARGSGLQAAKIVLGLVFQWLPAHWVPVWVVDDTVERRQGKRIQAKRGHPEAVRPTAHHGVGTPSRPRWAVWLAAALWLVAQPYRRNLSR